MQIHTFLREIMTNLKSIEYPALIYKKNNLYIADCLMFNLAAIGISEQVAIENLKKCIEKNNTDSEITIKPLYWEDCAELI